MLQSKQKFPANAEPLRGLERIEDDDAVAAELSTLTGRAPLFAEFTPADIKTLAEYMGIYRADANETIIREGDAGNYLLLIIRGEVEIMKSGLAYEQQHMTTVGAGTTVGEMSMVDGEARFATCRTTQATTFSVLTRENMDRLVIDRPALGAQIFAKLASMLSARLRQTSAKLMRYIEGMA